MYERIKNLCKERGISVSELEQIIGAGGRSLYKWDESMPSVAKVAKVAEYFGVSIDYLYGLTDSPKQTMTKDEVVEEAYDRPELRVLFDLAKDAPKEDVEYVIAKLRKMLS